MKRRTVVLEIEVEGPYADALTLRDEVARMRDRPYWKVERAEVLSDGRDD